MTNRTALNPVNEAASVLGCMLSTGRPDQSKVERKFISRWLRSAAVFTQDGAGNLTTKIGNSPILWSCHTDTAHHAPSYQRLHWDGRFLSLALGAHSSCLGGDDTAGVWLMREMIMAQVPGTYVFHRGEERGCKGSGWLARHTPEALAGIKAAIAFDRRGTSSVITHQMSYRCCSDTFAKSLAYQLGGQYRPDANGLYTDTHNYTDLVGECTNVSVGFQHEHSKMETLDMQHLVKLRDAIINNFSPEALVFERKPGDTETRWPRHWIDYDRGEKWRYNKVTGEYVSRDNYKPVELSTLRDPNEEPLGLVVPRTYNLANMVRNNPEAVADYLESMGIDGKFLENVIVKRQTYCKH